MNSGEYIQLSHKMGMLFQCALVLIVVCYFFLLMNIRHARDEIKEEIKKLLAARKD